MQLAWARRRELLSTISLILVPGLILILIARLLTTGNDATVINGYLLLPAPLSDGSRLTEGAIVCLTWAWAVSSGTLVVTGAIRGKEISPIAAVKQALRVPPKIGGVLFLTGAVFQLMSGLSVPMPVWLTVWTGALIIICRMLLIVPVAALGLDQHWHFSSERVTQTVFTVGMGVVAPAAAVAWLASPVQDFLSEGWLPGVAATAVAGLLIVVASAAVVALQAATLASLCLDLMEDTTATDALLTKLDAPARPRTAAIAGLIIPVVLVTGVAVVNPFGRPEVRANEMRLDEIYGAGWPAVQHPIILTTNGFLDCQDDECRAFLKSEFRTAARPPGLYPLEVGTVAVTPAGVVLRALAEQSGQIAIQRCTRTGTCQTGIAKMPAFQARIKLAITEAPDGAIYVATAHDLQTGKYEQALIRCADVSCAQASRQTAGTYEGSTDDIAQIHLGLTAVGMVRAVFGRDGYGKAATCKTVACSELEVSDSMVGSTLMAAITDDESVRLLHNTIMHDCRPTGCATPPHQFEIDCCLYGEYKPLALHVEGKTISAVIAQPAGSTRGTQQQTVLWQCLDVKCTKERKLPLQITPSTPDSVFLAANPDGRLLIVQSGEQDFVYTVAAA